ncbi:uncharacterized protein LOC126416507 [Schistocerca serialis cubense]|uniref:uncharacterized protein LOC126416507 n=1 Tax=Schistocerca serialis cubense TaxID=2023355 RepID=UPI00214F1552|nr:uncharacterized protein LOC126416507 [Schistocerca serialis cubense]
MATGGSARAGEPCPSSLFRLLKRTPSLGSPSQQPPQPPPRLPPLTDGGGEHSCSQVMLSREPAAVFPEVHFIDSCKKRLPDLHEDDVIEEQAVGHDFILYQALFHEVRSIVPQWEVPTNGNSIYYMLIGFKTRDHSLSQVMEDSWREWTSARYIYLNLPDELGLTRISLYRQKIPWSINIFSYIVLVECQNVSSKDDQTVLSDFAQRLRAERITGYISVYCCERHKLLPNGTAHHPLTNGITNGFSEHEPPMCHRYTTSKLY